MEKCVALNEPFLVHHQVSNYPVDSGHGSEVKIEWVGRLAEGSVWLVQAEVGDLELKLRDEHGDYISSKPVTTSDGSPFRLAALHVCELNYWDLAGRPCAMLEGLFLGRWRIFRLDLISGLVRVGCELCAGSVYWAPGFRWGCWRSVDGVKWFRRQFDPEKLDWIGSIDVVKSQGDEVCRVEFDGTVWFRTPKNQLHSAVFRWGEEITLEPVLPPCFTTRLRRVMEFTERDLEATSIAKFHVVRPNDKTGNCVCVQIWVQRGALWYREYEIFKAYETRGLSNRCAVVLAKENLDDFPDDHCRVAGEALLLWQSALQTTTRCFDCFV